MSKNLKTNIAISVEDRASSSIKKIFNEHQKGETKMAQSHKRFSDARKNLSVNSDKAIQREIQRTEASYNRLARAGFKSANEQQRAYDSMTKRVRELNAEMKNTEKYGQNWKNIAAAGGALLAGGRTALHVAKEPVMTYMDYQERLVYTANTAFDDRDVDGRIQGVEELDKLVRSTVQYGGTKEDAIAGINALLAPGELGFDQVENLAPIIQKTATATQSSTEEISKIVMAMLTNFDIAISEIPLALDMALKAGESGSFELQDMAGWLSQQLSMGAQRGMKGMDHYKDILVMNQQAARIAGSSDQAGNYVYSFLSAMTDASTIRAFENSAYKDGDKEGIDLIKSMNGMIAEGASPVEAFMEVMDSVIGSNKDYQKLLKEIDTAEGADKLAKLEQMATLLEGSEVSKILGNKQSLMGYIALRSQGEYGDQVAEALEKAFGAVDVSYQVVASTAKFKTEGFEANNEFNKMDAYKPIAESYASLVQTLNEYQSKYPELTQQLTLVTDALKVLIATAAGMAIFSKLLGGKGGGLGLPWGRPQTTVPGTQPPGNTPTAGNGKSLLKTGAMGAIRWAPVAGEAYALYEGSKDDVGNIIDKHDGFTPEAAHEIAETGYEKTLKPIVHTISKPFFEVLKSMMNAVPGLEDDSPESNSELIEYHYSEVPVIGGSSDNESPILEVIELNQQSSIEQLSQNPDYQPILIGGVIMRAIEQGMMNFQQQQSQVQPPPTVIQLNVTGELDGQRLMGIIAQHTIDNMNRGSNH